MVYVFYEGHAPIIDGVFGIQVHVHGKVVLVCRLRQIEFLGHLKAVRILRLQIFYRLGSDGV